MSSEISRSSQQSIAESSDDLVLVTFHFMDLPMEARRGVYRALLKADIYIALTPMRCQEEEWADYEQFSWCMYRFEQTRLRVPLWPEIISTSAQIHDEAINVLYGENFFLLHCDTGSKVGLSLRDKLPNYFDKIQNVELAVEDMEDLEPEDFPEDLTVLKVFRGTHGRGVHTATVLHLISALKNAGLQSIEFDETYKCLGYFKNLLALLMEKGGEEQVLRAVEEGSESEEEESPQSTIIESIEKEEDLQKGSGLQIRIAPEEKMVKLRII